MGCSNLALKSIEHQTHPNTSDPGVAGSNPARRARNEHRMRPSGVFQGVLLFGPPGILPTAPPFPEPLITAMRLTAIRSSAQGRMPGLIQGRRPPASAATRTGIGSDGPRVCTPVIAEAPTPMPAPVRDPDSWLTCGSRPDPEDSRDPMPGQPDLPTNSFGQGLVGFGVGMVDFYLGWHHTAAGCVIPILSGW